MSYLATAVMLLGVLTLANLALLFAVIRRLRQQAVRLAAVQPSLAPRMQPGASAPQFTSTTVKGDRIALDDLTGALSLVAFFSAHCAPCHGQLPEFTELAGRVPGGAGQVLAVVSGSQAEAADFVTNLDGVASVVVEPPRGPVATAFSNRGYPSFYVIGPDGRIQASGPAVRMVAYVVTGSVSAPA